MKRFLLLPLALLLAVSSVVSFGSSSVSAASVYDNVLTKTDSLIINKTGGGNGDDSIDFSLNWANQRKEVLEKNLERYPNDTATQTKLQRFNDVFYNQDENASWVVARTEDGSGLCVLGSLDPTAKIVFELNSEGSPSAYYKSDGINNIIDFGCAMYWPTHPNPQSSLGLIDGSPMQRYTQFNISASLGYQIFMANVNVEYPDGYEGDILPDSYAPPVQTDPLIDWWLTDKLVFSARYLDNLGIDNTAWTWKIFPADDNFQITGDPIYTSDEIQGINMFTYTFAEKGKYIARASFRIPAPGLPPPPEVRTTLDIQLNVDGYYQRGGTNHCQDGICNVPVIECAIQPTYLDRLNCKVEQMFNFGLLNPSLIAFRSLLSSFVVPTSPNCSIPLPNVQITPGRVFPLSSYSSIVCTRAEQLRNKFPIAPIVVNFALAMLLLWMIVKIINRILDNNKHDLIEGV